VPHPSLGLPPLDLTAGFPAAAERIRIGRSRLASRALDVALAESKDMRERHDEPGLRQLLLDASLLADRVAVAVAGNSPDIGREYAEWTAPLYRRRRIPMDDLIALCEGLRQALPDILTAEEMAPAAATLDEAIRVYRWHRRLAGDARKRNRLLQLLYKGG
jgi:hypothetical protein